MSNIREDTIEFGAASIMVEQRIKAGSQFDEAKPSLSTEPAGEQDFVPFFSDADGIFRMMNPGPTTPEATLPEGNHGGLFEFSHKQPVLIDHIMADLGTSIAYEVYLVTALSKFQIAAATSRYLWVKHDNKVILFPGEKISIKTTGATVAMWARVLGRLMLTT